MSVTNFQRARQPEQKEQRRESILSAATELLKENGVDKVSLSSIARRVGLAKSNVYRYFESREQIFLLLLWMDWAGWTEEIERELAVEGASASTDDVARLVTRAFVVRPRLCELISVVAGVLERNVSKETVVDFRARTTGLILRVAEALHMALPKISVDRCMWAVRTIHSMVAGLWPAANLSPAAALVAALPQFDELRPDFERDLEQAVRAVLFGLLVEAARKSHR